MNDDAIKPDDPAFLASQNLDESLSCDDRKTLDRVLESSASLRADAAAMATVDELVKRWGAGEAELDWSSYAALVLARVEAGDQSSELEKVDELLGRWTGMDADWDEEAFTASVMARVCESERRPIVRRLFFPWGAPLAAAAVLALAIVGVPWGNAPDQRISRVVFEQSVSAVETPRGLKPASWDGERASGRSIVSFERTVVADSVWSGDSVGISIGSVGVGPMVGWGGQDSP